jgi:hypothetical protein
MRSASEYSLCESLTLTIALLRAYEMTKCSEHGGFYADNILIRAGSEFTVSTGSFSGTLVTRFLTPASS